MKLEFWQAAVAVVVAVFGGGGAAALLRVGSRNQLDHANSAVVLATAYGKLIDQLETRIDALEGENKLLRDRVASLEGEVTALGKVAEAAVERRAPAKCSGEVEP